MDFSDTNLGSGFIGGDGFESSLRVPEPDDPDYIFQRARCLKVEGKDIDPFGNLFVTRFLRFYNLYEKAEDHEDLVLLRGRFPYFYKTINIREDPRDIRDHLLECGVLAEGEPKAVGEYLNLHSKVIKIYEKLYFDVRDKLESSGYVFGRLLPGIIKSEITTQSDEVQKLVAYTLGWDKFKKFIHCDRLDEEMRRALFNIARRQEGIKLLTAVHMENVDPKYAGFVLERWANMRDKMERDGTLSGDGSRTETFDQIQAQLKKLKINVPNFDNVEDLEEDEKRLLPEG